LIFDQGRGKPVIVVPGLQGRWEWMTPALEELRKHCRAISYTLSGDVGSDAKYDPALGFDNYIRQLDWLFLTTGLEQASLCGVSYGGFIALRYTALRPMRVTSLILVSSPTPGWVPNERQRQYLARPWLSAPAFVATAPMRLWPEIYAAFDTWPKRLAFAATHGVRVLAAPMHPARMAARMRLQQGMDFAPDCARVGAPTLVLTGEDDLDQVVPAAITRGYQSLISGTQYEKIERSGHIGLITRPKDFAKIVVRFVERET
jgi:pimeloyl-ACP methyl ester carboxylesterase